jgi:Uma2 family endonuclease
MADPAQRRMTVEEFLVWDGEGDTRYQLRDGVPVAMAPPSSAHSILAGNLAGHVFVVLQKRPGCRVQSEAGLRSSRNSRSFHHVDLGVSCSPATRGEHEILEPILLIEILSPSTAEDDRRFNLLDYQQIPSVHEIVLVESRFMHCEVYSRLQGDQWLVRLLQRPDDPLVLQSIGLDLPLSTIYANVPLEEAS